ncbi:MAG: hypothetical protein MI723_01280 [Caulobacterales bacterium]|nr:hypothetical protein [Caulobacterales bacterium]
MRAANRSARRRKVNVRCPNPLSRLLFDGAGARLTPTSRHTGGRSYRYYVSQHLVNPDAPKSGDGIRIPAGDVEAIVHSAIGGWLRNAGAVMEALAPTGGAALDLAREAAVFAERLPAMGLGDQAAAFTAICRRIDVGADAVAIRLSASGILEALSRSPGRPLKRPIDLRVPARTMRMGGETRMLTPEDETQHRGAPDPAILRALARAHDWAGRLTSGRARSINDIAREDGVGGRYVARLLPLGFLAPEIVERLMRGEHARTLTAEALTRGGLVRAGWAEQVAEL